MGTNFYYRTNICSHCNRADVLHVGKRSIGWSFGFRGYRNEDDIPDLKSRWDWVQFFRTTPGVLIDEYDREEPSAVLFLTELEAPSANQQKLEDSPEWRGPNSPRPNSREWRDTEGFRFYDGEFS